MAAAGLFMRVMFLMWKETTGVMLRTSPILGAAWVAGS